MMMALLMLMLTNTMVRVTMMMVNMSMMKVMISHLALWPTRSIICLDAFTFNATLDAMMRRAFDDYGRHIGEEDGNVEDGDQDDVAVEYDDTT